MLKATLLVLVACCAVVALAKKPMHEPLSQELVDYVNSAGTTWTAGHNKRFKNVPLSTIKHMMGHLPRPESHKKTRTVMKHPARLQVAVPDTFDSRTQWPNCASIGEVRDQGACGSCWALAAVEAMTDRTCISSNAANVPHISAEDLNSCCGSQCGFGCNGGYADGAWDFWVKTGLVTGGNFNSSQGCLPYTVPSCDHHVVGKEQPCGNVEQTPKCVKTCEPNFNGQYPTDKHQGKTSYDVNSAESNIQAEIQQYGPVEAGFAVYADFLAYKTGVYKHTTGAELGLHDVKIIGWGTESGTPYWLVVNSWNEDWGDSGLFKIARGTNGCGFEDSIVAGHAPTATKQKSSLKQPCHTRNC